MSEERRQIEQERLVLRCCAGEREAFEELIALWERRLFLYVRAILPAEDDAWAVLQDVWVAVLRSVRTLRDPGRLPPWLYGIARNRALAHHRRRYAEAELFRGLGDDDPPAGPVADPFTSVDDAEQVQAALRLLRPVDREVLTLYFLQDLDVAQVAGLLGIPAGTVKSRLYLARIRMRAALDQLGGPHD